MPADPRRLRIIEWAQARVETITRANGYRTDLGKQVVLGVVPTLGPDDPGPVLAVLPQEDQIGKQQVRKLSVHLPINFAVLQFADPKKPWRTVELGIADVKTAIESAYEDADLKQLVQGGDGNPNGILRGTTEPYPRTSGSEICGSLITYAFHYFETLGMPTA